MSASPVDRVEKQRRLSSIRAERAGAPILLESHEALTWYLDGARTHVSFAGPAVLAVVADDDGDTLYVATNEADRLADEELLPGDVERIVRVPWHIPPAVAAERAAARPVTREAAVAAELRAARASQLPGELERYRALGAEVAAAVTDICAAARPDGTERALAGELAHALTARGIDPLVMLVAGSERLDHRHPLPTGQQLGSRSMVVVCGRRHGLYANMTRWIGAAGADDERIAEVEAAFFAATVPGRPLSEAFVEGTAAYPRLGFEQDEWTRHHQGGPTGYAGRDPRAVPGVPDLIADRQAFAWNPTAPGAKIEDTVLVTRDGVEALTVDERWPTIEIAGRARPQAMSFG